MQGVGVKNSIADVRVVDSSDNHTVGADLKGGPLPALKRHRRFCNARRHYRYRFCGCQTCDREFRFSMGKAGGGRDHFIGKRFVGNVDDNLFVIPDVPSGILGDAGLLVPGGEGNDRGVGAKTVKKRKGRGIYRALLIYSCDPRNRARRNKARQHLIAFGRPNGAEV